MAVTVLERYRRRRAGVRRQRGFTLTELMVVVLIIGLLSAAAMVAFMPMLGQGRSARIASDMRAIDSALTMYMGDMGGLPSTQEGLDVLVQRPMGHRRADAWNGPYLQTGLPEDPWGVPYQYFLPGRGGQPYEVVTFGADGVPGGEGDNADIDNGLTPLS